VVWAARELPPGPGENETAAAAAPPPAHRPGRLGGDFTLGEARAVNDRGAMVGQATTGDGGETLGGACATRPGG
jgi:hypothetical protein